MQVRVEEVAMVIGVPAALEGLSVMVTTGYADATCQQNLVFVEKFLYGTDTRFL
jgi:hypothetical protein